MREIVAALRVLSAIRQMIALQHAQVALRAVACDAIKKKVLPALREELSVAKSESKRKKIEALMEEYLEYADPNNPKSEIFEKSAGVVIDSVAKKYQMGSQAEEAASNIASNFYIKDRWMDSFAPPRFDVMAGPLAMNDRWRTILNHQASSEFRDISRAESMMVHPVKTDEGYRDIFETTEAPTEFTTMDVQWMNQTISGLKKYIHKNAYDDIMRELANMWFGLLRVEEGNGLAGLCSVGFKHQILPMVQKRFKGITLTKAWEHWRDLKKLVAKFFEQELKIRLPSNVRQCLRMSSLDVLTYEEFRHRLAAWVLGMK